MRKYNTASLSGVARILTCIKQRWSVELGAIGTLLPLNDYIYASGKDKEILKSAIDSSTLDGNIYALPWISDATALIINKTAFEKAGINYSRDTAMNWSEFLEVAKKLTHDDHRFWNIEAVRGAAYGCVPVLYSIGGSLYSPDGTKEYLSTSPSVKKPLNSIPTSSLPLRKFPPGET